MLLQLLHFLLMDSVVVGDLCVCLESVVPGQGEGINQKSQGYEKALEQLLQLIKCEGEAGLSGEREECESVAERARLLMAVAGHIGNHYWTSSTSRKLANGEKS